MVNSADRQLGYLVLICMTALIVRGRVEYCAHLDPWGWRSVSLLMVTDDRDFQSSSVLLDGIFKEPCGRFLCKSRSLGVVRLALLH